jgi:CRISPR-associated endonuclease/helicase Cas3
VIAAHHGKVRLSIRSMPNEKPPKGSEATLIAREILDGDELPELS